MTPLHTKRPNASRAMIRATGFGRVLRTGLSSLWDRAASRLAALRINSSRVVGYAMVAAPFIGLYTLAFLMLSPFQAATVVIVPWLGLAWLAIAIRLLMR